MLRIVDAAFVVQDDAVGPLDLALPNARRETLAFANAREASIAARLCAGIVKPTRGSVFIGDYDTRLQPPQAKRCVGFVDSAGFAGDAHAFACEIAFRAEVWDLDVGIARTRARDALDAFATPHTGYARAIVLALVPSVALLVLDRPPDDAVLAVAAALVPDAAILVTTVRRAS